MNPSLDLLQDPAPRVRRPVDPLPPPTAACPSLVKMLDAVDYGVMMVDADGQLMFANLLARIELGGVGPLLAAGRRLAARSRTDGDALDTAVRDAAHKGLQRMLILGDAAGGQLSLAVTPLETAPGDTGTAMIALGRRTLCHTLSAQAAARLHGLTGAELRVLQQLCAGRRPIAIARNQGVEISTVRTQIGSIREKLGARDIVGVLAHMATLPPLPGLFGRP
jgi:DNA-binding CsgD family transcriptional regulator